MNRQLGVSAALADWQQNPSVEKAVAAHQAMRAFRQQGHAERFMRELQQRFHQDARLKAYHGTMLLEQGRKEEARLQLNEALKLRPELAEARVPMSRILMDDGDPDGAFKMLEFMLHPGSSQLYSLGPLEHLAMYLQPNNRQPEALRIFQHLVEELPAVAQVPAFRASVERTEKALRIKQSVLPPKKFSMHEVLFGTRAKLTKWVLFLAVAALFFSLRNFWIAGHRTIHVVNAWTEPVSLRISPDRTITVPPGRSTFTLAEGSYRIVVTGPVQEVIPLWIHGDFWGRWTKHPLWVLNPGGAAVLVESTLTIGGRNTLFARQGSVPNSTLLTGQRAMIFENVEYAFTTLPRNVSLKANEVRSYHQVTSYDGDPIGLVTLLSGQDQAAALKVAIAEMQRQPGDAQLREAVRSTQHL